MVNPGDGPSGSGEDGLVGYFGYGSLVNRLTLRTDYVATRRARLAGWRRHWQARGVEAAQGLGEIALLSVHRHAASTISGMLVIDRAAHLAQVDLRESHYDRVALGAADIALHDADQAETPDSCHVYVARPEPEGEGKPRLLQSYLDAVMAGFLAEYGEEGVREFLVTTTGFERGIILDRAAPLYPRAVELAPAVARSFDALLADAGVRFA